MRQLALPSAIALSLSLACGGSGAPSAPQSGMVRISASASGLSASSNTSTALCANFSLQAYVPAADGTPTDSGSPVVFVSSSNAADAAAFTDQVLGCLEGANDAAGFNWGYIATVTNFTQCGSGSAVSATPSTVTVNVPVKCQAGVDVPVAVPVQVAIP